VAAASGCEAAIAAKHYLTTLKWTLTLKSIKNEKKYLTVKNIFV
jgi:hypothetical protein